VRLRGGEPALDWRASRAARAGLAAAQATPHEERAPSASAEETTDGFTRLYEQVSGEIDRRHRPLRSWPPYFHLRHIERRLDTLPGSIPIGFDFAVWLVRR
jgi:hypothetical protein